MYENSVSIARIMIMVATTRSMPPSAVADHIKVDEWPRFGWYMVGALHVV